MVVAVSADVYKPPIKMATSASRAFYLPANVLRLWRVWYLCFIPLLFLAVILSSTRSLNSVQILRSVEAVVNRQSRAESDLHVGPTLEEARATPVSGDEAFPTDVANEWRVPRPMSEVHGVERGSDFAVSQERHPWTRPLVFKAHMRRSAKAAGAVDLFLYTTGVSMGNFRRNFTVRGCIVGADVYPVVKSDLDVVMCRVARDVPPGVPLSVAVQKDAAVEQARAGPVRLQLGLTVLLQDGDVTDVADDVRVRIPETEAADLVAVRSVVTARVSSAQVLAARDEAETARYEVCMVTQMKPYPHLLDAWADYHRRLGVDMVYVLDNAGPTDLGGKYASREDVEVLYWPWGRSQVQALSWFLVAGRSRCEWVLFTDADEYVMLGVGAGGSLAGERVLKRYVRAKRRAGFEQLFFRSVVMGASRHVKIPAAAPPEAYTHLHDGAGRSSVSGKVLLRTDKDWVQMRVHWGKALTGVRAHKGPTGGSWPPRPVGAGDAAALVHFQFRSWEEQRLKAAAGSASISDMHGAGGGGGGDGGGSGGVGVEARGGPPRSFSERSGGARYTHFRDVWRAVTRGAGLREQTVVRRGAGGAWCARVRAVGAEARVREERCEPGRAAT